MPSRLKRSSGRLVDGDVVGGGVGEGVFPRADVPLAPGRDDREVRREGGVGHLEAHLVVALAGGAVGQGIGALGEGAAHLAVGEERTRQGGAQQIVVLVDGPRGERLEGVVADELLAEVLDHAFRGAGGERLLAHRLEVVALAHVSAVGDDLGPV